MATDLKRLNRRTVFTLKPLRAGWVLATGMRRMRSWRRSLHDCALIRTCCVCAGQCTPGRRNGNWPWKLRGQSLNCCLTVPLAGFISPKRLGAIRFLPLNDLREQETGRRTVLEYLRHRVAETNHRLSAALQSSIGDGLVCLIDIFGAQGSHVSLRPAEIPKQFIVVPQLWITLTSHNVLMFFPGNAAFLFEFDLSAIKR